MEAYEILSLIFLGGLFAVGIWSFIVSLKYDSDVADQMEGFPEAMYMFLGAILSCNPDDGDYRKQNLIYDALPNPDGTESGENYIMDHTRSMRFRNDTPWSFLNDGSELSDYAEVIIKNLTFRQRRNFIHLLFKLAADDDGIKNDEWQRLLNIMSLLKMNKANYDYLIRQYVGLRTEFDDYSSQQQSSGSSSSSSSSSSYTTTSSALSADYALLGLTSSATQRDVQDAYHKLALQYHPDLPKNAGNQQFCIDQMAKINAAYDRIMTKFA